MTGIETVGRFLNCLGNPDWEVKQVSVLNDSEATWKSAQEVTAHLAKASIDHFMRQGYTVSGFDAVAVPGFGLLFKFKRVKP